LKTENKPPRGQKRPIRKKAKTLTVLSESAQDATTTILKLTRVTKREVQRNIVYTYTCVCV